MSSPLKIALADDELEILDYFAGLLRRLGHEVIAAALTGLQLLEMCRLRNPDLIITDIVMPDMNGLETAREIVAICPVPVIVVSSLDRPADLGDHYYVVDYLVKPIKAVDLELAVAKITTPTRIVNPYD